MKRKPIIAFGAAAILALSACAAQTGTEDTHQAPEGYLVKADADSASAGTLHIQLDYDTAEVTGLDPAGAELARGWQITGLVYDTLVSLGPNFEITPELAESFEQVSDTEYLFTLRDAKFSNGRTVTTDDVIGSLERLRELGTLWSVQLGQIESIQASGEREVRITLSAPHAPFLAALANTPAAIMPIQEIEAGELDPENEMLGSGAFMMQSHRQDESWIFVRNPEYWGSENLGIDELHISIVGNDQTRLAGLRDGSVAFTNFANPDAKELLGTSANISSHIQTQSNFFYIYMNSVNPDSPFTDEELRQAVNAALDREQLINLALAGHAQVTGITPVNLPGACDPNSLPTLGGDTSKVAGVEIDLLIYNDDPALASLAQVIQQQLQTAGAKVNIESLDYATYASRVYESQPGEFEMALGWFAGYADPSMVTGWWNPEQARFNAGFTGSHSDLNQAIAQARETTDAKERAQALQRACNLADSYSEIVPLATQPMVIAYRNDLVSPSVLTDEGYGDFLRLLPEFRILQEHR